MVVDGVSFLNRAHRFFLELKANRFPNAVTLAEHCSCSRNTAQRTIYRLRDEYGVPFDYDESEKGYFLLIRDYELPPMLPPGKDELAALLLAREMLQSFDAGDIGERLENLWLQLAVRQASATRDLEPITRVFSCDSTAIGDLADHGLLTFVTAAQTGESLELQYKSPWSHSEPKRYLGRIERVHLSDGHLYLLFADERGRRSILNAAFVKEVEISDKVFTIPAAYPQDIQRAKDWLNGFGIWAGEKLEEVEIRIGPPAAEYYAVQRWHSDQIDTWEGDVLVRKFRSMLSPELVRRILSLGQYVLQIKPPKLCERILSEIKTLSVSLGRYEEVAKIE